MPTALRNPSTQARETSPPAPCFHCDQPALDRSVPTLVWDGAPREFCCRGCAAVARAIVDSGLDGYYRFRTAPANGGVEALPDALRELKIYDHPSLQRQFVRTDGDRREAVLILEGITCAACVWLNEQHLKALPGVIDAQVNYATRRARVTWDDTRLHLSDILQAVRTIGYRAHPFDPARSQVLLASERRTLLKRIGVAGVLSAQVMVLSEALYLGDWSGSDPAMRSFFSWISLLLTLPVLAYSAQPFFRTAWNDLSHGRAGMDVPVALGLAGAFAASLWSTLTGNGVAYYDAVTMLAFLLLGGRYFELAARTRAAEAAESLVLATPALATRLAADGATTVVAAAELVPGDILLVRAGESVAADGIVIDGRSSTDESLLTGESRPIPKHAGDRLIGGSINIESPLKVRVEKVGPETALSAILRLLDRAQAEKPRLAQLADRVAGWFVVAVLLFSVLVAGFWWLHDVSRVLPVLVSVLVVTCPCALGLATPAALSAATGVLARQGLLATRGHALETLARATHFVFDKTGTLTRGELQLSQAYLLTTRPRDYCLALAGALERHSEHPIARAILGAAPAELPRAYAVISTPGDGLHGKIDGKMVYLGTPAYIERATGFAPDRPLLEKLRRDGGTLAILATRRMLLAVFVLEDTIRPEAHAVVAELKRLGKHVVLLTGDHADAAQRVARALEIDTVHAGLKPEEKLADVRRLQAHGAVVAMIGDGVNDAPVLAGAQVSIAIGTAAHVTAASADMLLLSPDLRQLSAGVAMAQRTLAVIRQNLAWAIAYNLLALPLAAFGWVAPWAAALGMSLSSALVVTNALRLTRTPPAPVGQPASG